MRARSSIAAFGFLAAAFPALAAQPGSVRLKTYGTQDQIVLTLGPCDAHDRTPANPFQVFTCDFLKAAHDDEFNSAVPSFPLHLPEGSLLEEVDFHYYDSIDGSQPFVSLLRMGQDPTVQIISQELPPFSGGETDASIVIIPPHEIHNEGSIYVLNMNLDTTDLTHYEGLYRVTIRYRLQVSPPPATATFGDVPVLPVRRGAGELGDHGGMRQRKLLPGPAADARTDGGVPVEGAGAALGESAAAELAESRFAVGEPPDFTYFRPS